MMKVRVEDRGCIFWQASDLSREEKLMKMRLCGMETQVAFAEHSREAPKVGEFGNFMNAYVTFRTHSK